MFKKFILPLLLITSLVFAQSTHVWKYTKSATGNRTVRTGWTNTSRYYDFTSLKADSMTSEPFAPNTRYHDYNGLLRLSIQSDTLTNAAITTNGSLSFRLHFHDGLGWQESNDKLLLWLATDSSSTTENLGDAQSGLKYYYTTDPTSDGLEGLEVSQYRVEMFWSDSIDVGIGMAWGAY